MIGENILFEAITTDRYYQHKRTKRRLLVNHNVSGWLNYGIWQSDKDVLILE